MSTIRYLTKRDMNFLRKSAHKQKAMSDERATRTKNDGKNSLVKLCPKQVIHKLTLPGIIILVIRRLVLENEVYKEERERERESHSIQSLLRKVGP